MKKLMIALAMTLALAVPLQAQGVSLGTHFTPSGGHPHATTAIELRAPALGPVTVALDHAAVSNAVTYGAIDRSGLLALVDLPGPLVAVGGMEASRVWIKGSCGPTGYTCSQEWHTGTAFGVGITGHVVGARYDIRYMRWNALGDAERRGGLMLMLGFGP